MEKLRSPNGIESREVIAHFSLSKLVWGCIGWLAVTVLVTIMAHELIFARPVNDPIKHGMDIWTFAIIGLGLLVLLVLALRKIRLVIANQGEAIWLENGRLVYADRKILDAPLEEIRSVELVRQPIYGTPSPWPPRVTSIVVRLENGREAKLPANGFSENRDDIVASVLTKLRLS